MKLANTILFFYPDQFLWHNTINLALKNIANQFQLNYKPCIYASSVKYKLRELEPDETVTLACFEINPDYNIKDYNVIKEKFPNAKIVMFGGDVVYYGGANGIEWPLDLLLDTMTCVTKHSHKFPAEFFFWSVSETILQDIQSVNLSTVKDKAFVSLCKDGSAERKRFFQDLIVHGHRVHWQLNLWNLHDIYQFYASCKFALGHTTPVHDGKARSMKGWRDWIAPQCGTVLLYDDFEDIRNLIPGDILPTYRYLDSGEVIRLVQLIDNTPGMYEQLLEKQRKWAWENSLEKQLIRIFKKYEFL